MRKVKKSDGIFRVIWCLLVRKEVLTKDARLGEVTTSPF